MTDVTQILTAIKHGDSHAAAKLLPVVYDELRRLAAQRLALEKPGQTLQATALVHEALARMQNDAAAADRSNRLSLDLRNKLATADPKSERRLMELLLVQSRTGGHKSVADQAAKILQKPNLDREVMVELAECYSQAAASVSDDPALRRQYLDQSLGLLQRAVKQGYKDVVVLETDPDLGAVRDEPGFRALLTGAKRGD